MAFRRIWTTGDIASEVTRRYNIPNFNQLAEKFGVAFGTCRAWTRGGTMDEEAIKTAAMLLDEDAGWLAACIALERLKDEKLKASFRAVLIGSGSLAASVFAAFFAVSLLPIAGALLI